jgi:hypothetical protein
MNRAAFNEAYIAPDAPRPDPYVPHDAEHCRRIHFLFGRTSAGPKPIGAGARLPNHERVSPGLKRESPAW